VTQGAVISGVGVVEPLPARRVPQAVDASLGPHAEEATGDRRVRALRYALGAIWLLDGALQLQPFMFTRGFVSDVIVPSAQGNAGFVSHPTLAIAHLMLADVATWNALFATIQVLLGAGILAGTRTRRASLLRLALAGSIAWSAAVWWLGEGLGGVLAGASPLAGAPGAVALYAVAGVLLWPGDGASAPLLGSHLARALWAGSWAISAFLLLEPPNQARGAVASVVSQAATGEPGPVRAMLAEVAGSLRGAGPWLDSLLALVMLGIGLAVALRFLPRAALFVSIVLASAIWVFGEAFGGILSGQGTDPNSGPLWVLLSLCMWAGLGGQATVRVPGAHAASTATDLLGQQTG
jgi:hypothetical protein